MIIKTKKLFDYWHDEAGYSWDIAQSLFSGKKYPESLFFAHLALEKILKALVVAHTRVHAPPIHNLAALAMAAELSLNEQQIKDLRQYSDFYLASRYDEEKMTFRKQCTLGFAKPHFERMEEYYLWLKSETEKLSPRK